MIIAGNITGQKFAALTAIAFVDVSKKHARWLFRCDCGNHATMDKSNVVRGRVKACMSCGRKAQGAAISKHLMSHSREYKKYAQAKQRCQNPNCERYPGYGGRGIEFKFSSFEEFYALLGECPIDRTLDRIDNDGHYEPGNVRWATKAEQYASRRPWNWKK